MSEPTVTFDPVKNVVVHDVTYLEEEEMLISMGHGTPVGQFGRSMFWAEGVAFVYSVLPWNDRTVDEYLQGTVHINSVVFTRWSEYKPVIELPTSGGVLPGVKIPLWDVTTQPQMVALAKWLKRHWAETHMKEWLAGKV